MSSIILKSNRSIISRASTALSASSIIRRSFATIITNTQRHQLQHQQQAIFRSAKKSINNHYSPIISKTFRRSYTVLEEEPRAPVIDFAQMQAISKEKDPSVVIVDTREPDEYAAGCIPGSVNIPVRSSPGALGLSNEEFQLNFGFDKPSTDKQLVFYCLAGVRSSMSEELASTFEYKKRLNYVGSWEDWIAHNGEIEIPKQKQTDEE